MSASPQIRIWAALFACAGGIAVIFLIFPEIDIATSNLFFRPTNSFALANSAALNLARDFFKLLFALSFLFALLMLALSFIPKGTQAVARPVWLFILGAYLLGPGVLVNLVLKNNWGRARPAQIDIFGGQATFTPPLFIADQCPTNCSFVSGETSTIATLSILVCTLFWTKASRQTQKIMVAAAIFLTGAASYIRIAMGRHFLSDTLFSALFCAMIILALFQLMHIERYRNNLTPNSMISDFLRVFRVGKSDPKN